MDFREDSHPAEVRSGLAFAWLDMTGFTSVRKAATALRVSQPSLSRWLSAVNEPSRMNLAVMAGYIAEGQNGLVWGRQPLQSMVGFASHKAMVSDERIRALAVTGLGSLNEVPKQGVWRLYEVTVAAALGYSLHSVERIEWDTREVIQYEKPAVRRHPSGRWLPPNFLHLGYRGHIPTSQTNKAGPSAPAPLLPNGRRPPDINKLWGIRR